MHFLRRNLAHLWHLSTVKFLTRLEVHGNNTYVLSTGLVSKEFQPENHTPLFTLEDEAGEMVPHYIILYAMT